MGADVLVARPDPQGDRFRPTPAIAAAALGFLAGIGVVWLAQEAKAPPGEAHAAAAPPAGTPLVPSDAGPPRIEASAPPPPASRDASAASSPNVDAESEEDGDGPDGDEVTAADEAIDAAVAMPSAPPVAEPAPTDPPVPAGPVTKRGVHSGTVAYLRCDGLELGTGRYPCPRDRAFETIGWEALGTLSACAGGDPGAGALEARIELSGHDVTVLRFRKPDDSGIDLGAVERCVGDVLRGLHTEFEPERMIVSFRLELR